MTVGIVGQDGVEVTKAERIVCTRTLHAAEMQMLKERAEREKRKREMGNGKDLGRGCR